MNQQTADRIEEELSAAQRVIQMKAGFLDKFFEDKEGELWRLFNDIRIGDEKALVNLHHQCKSMNALRGEVQNLVDTGKLAQAEKTARTRGDY